MCVEDNSVQTPFGDDDERTITTQQSAKGAQVLFEWQTSYGRNGYVSLTCDPNESGIKVTDCSVDSYVATLTGKSKYACEDASPSPTPKPTGCMLDGFSKLGDFANEGPFTQSLGAGNGNVVFALCTAIGSECDTDFASMMCEDEQTSYGDVGDLSVERQANGVLFTLSSTSSNNEAYIVMECADGDTKFSKTLYSSNDGTITIEGTSRNACPDDNASPTPLPSECVMGDFPDVAQLAIDGPYIVDTFELAVCTELMLPCSYDDFGVSVCERASSPSNEQAYGSFSSEQSSAVLDKQAILFSYQWNQGNSAQAAVLVRCDADATSTTFETVYSSQYNNEVGIVGSSPHACPSADVPAPTFPDQCLLKKFTKGLTALWEMGTFHLTDDGSTVTFSVCQPIDTFCQVNSLGSTVCLRDADQPDSDTIFGELANVKVGPMVNDSGVFVTYQGTDNGNVVSSVLAVTCDESLRGKKPLWDKIIGNGGSTLSITGQAFEACTNYVPPPSPTPGTPTPTGSPEPNKHKKDGKHNGVFIGLMVAAGVILIIAVCVCVYLGARQQERRRMQSERMPLVRGQADESAAVAVGAGAGAVGKGGQIQTSTVASQQSSIGSVGTLSWANNPTPVLSTYGTVMVDPATESDGASHSTYAPPSTTSGNGGGVQAAVVDEPAVSPVSSASTLTLTMLNKTIDLDDKERVMIPQFNFADIADRLTSENMVARGNFGEVFVCMMGGKTVAVKRAFVAKDDRALEVRRAFVQETHLLYTSKHPNILKVYGGCFTLPNLCFISEYLDKTSLFNTLHKKNAERLQFSTKVNILLQVASGMTYLHEREPPIIHRDLKSLNVLLSGDNEVRIADFGLARSLQQQQSHVVTVHKHAGSPAWMAPELLRDEEASINSKVDVFAFGVMAWEVISERVPWKGCAYADIIRRVGLGRERVPSSALRDTMNLHHSDVDLATQDSIITLIETCMAEDPKTRPSFDTLHSMIERLVNATSLAESWDLAMDDLLDA